MRVRRRRLSRSGAVAVAATAGRYGRGHSERLADYLVWPLSRLRPSEYSHVGPGQIPAQRFEYYLRIPKFAQVHSVDLSLVKH